MAADAQTQRRGVRRKLEETFGQFELAQLPQPQIERAEEDLVTTLARGMRENKLVEIEYQKEVDVEASTRLVEPYSLERQMPNWYVHTWDRTSGAERAFRLDRMRSAKLTREKFEPREGFEPTRLRGAARTDPLHAGDRALRDRARRPQARGARALREIPVGSDGWLRRGSCRSAAGAVVLEAGRAAPSAVPRAQLAKELGVERLRAPA